MPNDILQKKNAIYAMVEDGKVMYVGQTRRTIKKRFDSYAGNKRRLPKGKSRGSGKFLAPAINANRIIEIWLWFPELDDYEVILKQKSNGYTIPIHYINVLDILESNCIAGGIGKPPWNDKN